MLKKILAISFLCVCLTVISYMEASAGTKVDTTGLRETSVSPSYAMTVVFPNYGSGSVYVGVYNLAVTDYFDEYLDNPPTTISGFCIEDVISTSTSLRYGIWTIDDNTKYEKAAWVADQYFHGSLGWSAQATQLAIWEIVMEDTSTYSYDLSGGVLRVTNDNNSGAYITEANDILTYMGANMPSNWNQARWYLALHPEDSDPGSPEKYQNYIVEGPPVPEPTTLVLIGTGILGVFGYAKKRKFFKKAA